jgi:glutathione S-transferase
VRIERDDAQSDPAYLALNPLGVVPTLVDDANGMLRFFYPERYGGGDSVRAAGAADAQRAFDIVETALEGREWLAADHRTGADLFLFMVTRWGRQLSPPAWDRPRLREHFVRTLALPGVRRMIDEQGLELPPWAE